MTTKSWLSDWMDTLNAEKETILKGGGVAQIEKQHKKGKLTARERISTLIDKDSTFDEVGLWAGYGMYEEEGGCPAGGVVTGIGMVSGHRCMIIANDATVKAGAWFPITAKKNLRAQEIALENRLPLIYLVDSAGVYLPLQDEIFPDKEHFGRIFRNNAILSAKGIPQIAAIMGSCVAGGAYLPVMSDESLMVEGTGTLFLAGSYLVRAAIGEDVDSEILGGASTHSQISGVIDYRLKNDADCLDKIRTLIGALGPFRSAGFTRQKPEEPEIATEKIADCFPEDRNRPYDMHELLKGLIDRHSFTEYKAEYGQTLVTGYARLDGWSIGIVANQRNVVKNSQGEMQIGGVIYSDSADKAARFIMNCNQKRIPILFLQDVTGFMIGKRSEHGGIIKDGAKMVNAVANSTVPKITVIVGNSYGAGNYAMCGRAYDPRFIFAWPTARIAVMGGNQAAEVLTRIRISSLQSKNREISDEEKSGIENEIRERYERQTDVRYAAARLWVDGIIHPSETRRRVSEAIHCANRNPEIPDFKTGVFQV